MKKNLSAFVLLIALSAAFTSCKDKAKEAETAPEAAIEETHNNTEGVTFNVDPVASTMEWKGTKPTGEHFGTISFAEGTLVSQQGQISGGNIVIDMNSIVVVDIPAEDEGNAKLLGHLKNEDFFDVENHPTSTFEVIDFVESEGKKELIGNLTIKGITHKVTVPVTVNQTENDLTITSETFTIDRTKWDIKYASKSIFGDLGDKFISDDMEFKIVVKATKA
ncbi:YceI family protein [Tamlana sp. s12]|uniref:YceI family protein n=1 Tax=Tamlana sp. s12 TaxID=1630406 RepID=UPI0007FF7620|nr:YceI family protein [Tamlana sp. s12]OBQ56471.1 hypothetical protein VQ01_03705 [Tamlana sp. s12]QQY81905.1 YceI family protein [Tamlana sp. s12]